MRDYTEYIKNKRNMNKKEQHYSTLGLDICKRQGPSSFALSFYSSGLVQRKFHNETQKMSQLGLDWKEKKTRGGEESERRGGKGGAEGRLKVEIIMLDFTLIM